MNVETKHLILGTIGAGLATLGAAGKIVNIYAENKATQAVIIQRIEGLANTQEKILGHLDDLRIGKKQK